MSQGGARIQHEDIDRSLHVIVVSAADSRAPLSTWHAVSHVVVGATRQRYRGFADEETGAGTGDMPHPEPVGGRVHAQARVWEPRLDYKR